MRHANIYCLIPQWALITMPVLVLICAGCSEGAKLIQDTPTGGVVSYLYKEERGAMFSRFRKEALEIMANKCPSGYAILQEGEARGNSAMEDSEYNSGSLRRAIRFQCKGADLHPPNPERAKTRSFP